MGVNNAERIVGFAEAFTGNDQAMIWNSANYEDNKVLDAPFSQAYGINDAGQVVGVSGNTALVTIPR
jgi:uncharacterized membrane protein